MIEPTAVVSFSGGKDSTATAILAIDRYGLGRVRLVYADTGNEHELTEDYVRNYIPERLGVQVEVVRADLTQDIERKRKYVAEKWPAKGVPSEVVSRAMQVLVPTGVPFLDLCLLKGRFPSRLAQFCTQFLKRYPLEKYMFSMIDDGFKPESWQGIRRDESRNRADAKDEEWVAEGWKVVRPIAAWTAEQVFDLLKERGVDPNPLYKLGCGRVGCMPCINATKGEISVIASRWPHHVDRIREWEHLVGEASKRGFSTFFTFKDTEMSPEEVWNVGNIDERVAWSLTGHGGKQFDLFSVDVSECSSIYGLCE